MMIPRPILCMMLVAACVLMGCGPPEAGVPAEGIAKTATRNNCYSLLHQLLEQEKSVSLLRFIKREPEDVKALVKKIADTSAAGASLLAKLAKDDPSIRLDAHWLPPGEAATRLAIAASKREELLGQTGAAFELSLLLTQAEALNYGWHLARVASQCEAQPDRARVLAGVSQDLEHLYDEVFGILLREAGAPGTNAISTSPLRTSK